jgi:preprotein translocase subunit SecG
MLKTLAVVRTVFFLFLIGFRLYASPPYMTMPRTLDEQYSRCASAQQMLSSVAWVAIAWIALEVLLGWIVARRQRSAPALQPPPPAPGPG